MVGSSSYVKWNSNLYVAARIYTAYTLVVMIKCSGQAKVPVVGHALHCLFFVSIICRTSPCFGEVPLAFCEQSKFTLL